MTGDATDRRLTWVRRVSIVLAVVGALVWMCA